MKLAQLAVVMTAAAITATATAGTVTGSSNVNFLAFDGQKLARKSTIQINDEKMHQIALDVSSVYKSGSDSTFFESSPIVIAFNGSSEDIKVIAPDLRSSFDIDAFKNKPSFTLQTASGKQLDYKIDYLKGEGFMPNANIENNLATYNAGNGVAAVKGLSVPMAAMMPTPSGKAAKGKVMVQGENIAEQQLQYWFQQADKETQKRFLDWAKKQ